MNTQTETNTPARVAIIPTSWPNIVFNEQAVARLAEVDTFWRRSTNTRKRSAPSSSSG